MRFFIDVKSATVVYKNMILPMIEYGDIFLVGTNLENRKKFQILQNKGLRCVLNMDKDTSRRELHGEGKILQLKHRRELHLLSYMYDMSRVPSKLKRTRKVGVKTRSQNKKLQRIRKTNNSLVNEK